MNDIGNDEATGLMAVEAADERLFSEGRTLAIALGRPCARHSAETRCLIHAALLVWAVGRDGTSAARTALLRSVAALVLNDPGAPVARRVAR